eukprot:2854236-Lingulodinium_polyedra.AAC.1
MALRGQTQLHVDLVASRADVHTDARKDTRARLAGNNFEHQMHHCGASASTSEPWSCNSAPD